jgi:thioredoxin 1
MRRPATRAFARTLAAAALFAVATSALAAPQNEHELAPQDMLAEWHDAVLSGDQTALAKFYLPEPRTAWLAVGVHGERILRPEYDGVGDNDKMADGKMPTPWSAEVPFWAGLRAQGLIAIEPKILQEEDLDMHRKFLVLRVELTFADSSAATPKKQVIAMRQTWVQSEAWVQSLVPWHIAATRRNPAEPMEAISLPQPATPNPHLYPAPGDAQTELTEALALARHDGKRVLVIFGATWCYDCHVLDATLRSPAVAPLVAANYHVIHINIGDGDDNADLAARFQVPLDKGIPSLAVLDPDGRLVTSQKNGEFESAARIGMQDVTGFLERWKPAAKPQ